MRVHRQSIRRRGVILPAVGSALLTYMVLTFLIGPGTVHSADPYFTFIGCRYDPDSIDPISYRFFSVGSAYETAFQDAEEEWDDTSAPGYFQEHSTSPDPEINVTDDYSSGAWGARVVGKCSIRAGDTFGEWSGNEVELQFNTRVMNNLSATDKELVAMHEIGHAYGLDHVSSGCRLMREELDDYNSCGSSMPTSNDIAGVHQIYP